MPTTSTSEPMIRRRLKPHYGEGSGPSPVSDRKLDLLGDHPDNGQ